MRLWSLHPQQLCTRSLVAVWREGLLARKVLQGLTKGYRHHPQLLRFKSHPEPLRAIEAYLTEVYDEADARGYHFNFHKVHFTDVRTVEKIKVTQGQLDYESRFQRSKQLSWNVEHWVVPCEAHPLFDVVPGAVEPWEKVKEL